MPVMNVEGFRFVIIVHVDFILHNNGSCSTLLSRSRQRSSWRNIKDVMPCRNVKQVTIIIYILYYYYASPKITPRDATYARIVSYAVYMLHKKLNARNRALLTIEEQTFKMLQNFICLVRNDIVFNIEWLIVPMLKENLNAENFNFSIHLLNYIS